jgi:hypothetical protein
MEVSGRTGGYLTIGDGEQERREEGREERRG